MLNILDFIKKKMNIESCISKFNELEFEGFVKQLGAELNNTEIWKEITSDKNYRTILNIQDLDELLNELSMLILSPLILKQLVLNLLKLILLVLVFQQLLILVGISQ